MWTWGPVPLLLGQPLAVPCSGAPPRSSGLGAHMPVTGIACQPWSLHLSDLNPGKATRQGQHRGQRPCIPMNGAQRKEQVRSPRRKAWLSEASCADKHRYFEG